MVDNVTTDNNNYSFRKPQTPKHILANDNGNSWGVGTELVNKITTITS
jgi:hypothetical protein